MRIRYDLRAAKPNFEVTGREAHLSPQIHSQNRTEQQMLSTHRFNGVAFSPLESSVPNSQPLSLSLSGTRSTLGNIHRGFSSVSFLSSHRYRLHSIFSFHSILSYSILNSLVRTLKYSCDLSSGLSLRCAK